MTATATITAGPARTLDPSPTLNGHAGERVPAGCVLLDTDQLQVGDVVRHAEGTFELVTDIVAMPTSTTRRVHVLRTRKGRTVACSYWIGEHARRTVHKVGTTVEP